MLPISIAIIAITVILILWLIFIQRKLVILDENVSDAMSKIGVQLSNCVDALMALLYSIKSYGKQESELLIETIKSRRILITAKSTPDDVLSQERLISEVLGRIVMITEQYPELKSNQTYIKTMDGVEAYENMIRTSLMIYNKRVAKLNREIRMLPVSMIAGTLSFKKRKYLEEDKTQ